MPVTIRTQTDAFTLPSELNTLAGFRRWAASPQSPDRGTIWFVRGNVWIDTQPQQVFSEVAVRTAIVCQLRELTRRAGGLMLGRRAFWFHSGVPAAGNPDGMYVSASALGSGRVRLLPDPPHSCNEVEGTPDMMLDILRCADGAPQLGAAYYEAGVTEYWLVDARGDEIEFHIYKRSAKKFSATKNQDRWVKSAVFGKSFRLTRGRDANGNPEFTLEVK